LNKSGKPVDSGPLLPSWRRRAEKTERPQTPTLPDEPEDVEEQNLALILLQKLIRGRAVQNMMFEGKERRGELIAELRESEQELADAETTKKEDALNQQAERGIQVLEGAMDTLQGEAISATLDFLSKELVRKNEQERLMGIAADADAVRVKREAEEGGRRQAEENLRAREDMMYRQVMRVHQGTAETYTQELLGEKVDEVAHQQAVAEVTGNAAAVAPISNLAGASEEEQDGTIRDLVASFLLPEVERHRIRQQIQEEEKRFVDAAHKSIAAIVQDVEDQVE